MKIEGIIWLDNVVDKLSFKHKVETVEVEEIFNNKPKFRFVEKGQKEGEDVYNGAFQYTTSRERSWIHNDGFNNWAAVCYLTPNAPVTSGTGFYKFCDGTRNCLESEGRGNKELIDKASQDMTKWQLVDQVGNVFNRLVIFNSFNYHMSQEYFGTDKNDGRLFQVFFFSTEM